MSTYYILASTITVYITVISMSPTKFDYFLSCKGAHLSKMPLFRHLIFFRNLSRLFQTSNILEVMVSVFKAALVKIHPLNPIHCCFYLTECDGILLAGCIGVQMSHFVCSIPPPQLASCVSGWWKHISSVKLLFIHLLELDPVTHIQRHRLHTILLQWKTLHGT